MSRKRTLTLLIFAGLICGCSRSPIGPGLDAAAVDAFLKVNLKGAKYEVVKWWPGLDSESVHAAKVKSLNESIEKCEGAIQSGKELVDEIKAGRQAPGVVRNPWDVEKDLASSIKTLAILQKESGALARTRTTRICRIRFCTMGPSGKAVTNDRIFEIEGGKAFPIDSKSEYEKPEYTAAVAEFGN